jgi:hypothetical protein
MKASETGRGQVREMITGGGDAGKENRPRGARRGKPVPHHRLAEKSSRLQLRSQRGSVRTDLCFREDGAHTTLTLTLQR